LINKPEKGGIGITEVYNTFIISLRKWLWICSMEFLFS